MSDTVRPTAEQASLTIKSKTATDLIEEHELMPFVDNNGNLALHFGKMGIHIAFLYDDVRERRQLEMLLASLVRASDKVRGLLE